jgi:hypothetical protein
MRYYGGIRPTSVRTRMQLAEAFGSTNRYFCSAFYDKPIRDREMLLAYFAANTGCTDFARRFKEAMSRDNRYFCSQFYQRAIDDPKILWAYYKKHSHDRLRRVGLELQSA